MLESADRVLRALESFTPDKKDLSLNEISERLGLPKSSVHRLLATLIDHHFVERDPASRRYRLGIRLFEIGSAAIHERGLHNAAHPILEELANQLGETTHLAVLSGGEAVYVYKIDGPHSILMPSRVGGRAPCHCTAIGKVLVAWGSHETFKQVEWLGLSPRTKNTITSVTELRTELEKVRQQGFALDLEEFEEGLRCLAAPVRDQAGSVVAAIGIAGPSRRLSHEQLRKLVEPVTRAALELSRNLGYLPDGRYLDSARARD